MRIGILVELDEQFASKLDQVCAIGFASGQVSVWNMDYYNDEQAERMSRLCREKGFEITGLWCGWSGPVDWTYPGMYDTLGLVPAWLRERRMGDLLKGAAFARQLGVRDIITHLGFLPDNPRDETFLAIVAALKVIGSELGRHGQRLLFETGEELPVTLIQLMLATGLDNLGVNFDPANLLTSGRANSVDALTLLSPYLMGMHGKDGVYPQGVEPKGRQVPLGQGQANYPKLLQILREIGYDGDITIEREGVTPEEWSLDVAAGRRYLLQLLEGRDGR